MLQSLREEREGKLQMLLPPKKNGLDSLFEEVRIFMVYRGPRTSRIFVTEVRTHNQMQRMPTTWAPKALIQPSSGHCAICNTAAETTTNIILSEHCRPRTGFQKLPPILCICQKPGDHPNFRKNALGVKKPFSELSESSGVFSEQLSEFKIPFSEYKIPFSEWHPTT